MTHCGLKIQCPALILKVEKQMQNRWNSESLGQLQPLRKSPISVPQTWAPGPNTLLPALRAALKIEVARDSPPYLGLQVILSPSPPCQGLGAELSFFSECVAVRDDLQLGLTGLRGWSSISLVLLDSELEGQMYLLGVAV